MTIVETGLARIFSDPELASQLEGRRVAWLVNAASVDAELRHAVDLSLAAGHRVERLFGPEHGLRGAAQDMIGVSSAHDPITGLPTVSLYGHDVDSLKPSPDQLDGLDVVLIDLQDIGTRYYTYAYTAALMVDACAAAGVEAWVLDRPNPLGGRVVEGNVVIPGSESFVGWYPGIATRHGLTLCELIQLLSTRYGWDDALTCVEMRGWRRDLHFDQTGLPWVMPSPNMPTLETAFVYPGQCLLEGTTMSEGRGTTRPFEIFGAPWLSPEAVLDALDVELLDGARLRPLSFLPMFQKHAGEGCGGFQLHVHDRERFRSLGAAMELIRAIRAAHPEDFGWRREPYEFVSNRLAIDLLFGEPIIRHAIEDGTTVPELLDSMTLARAPFMEERAASLIYPEEG